MLASKILLFLLISVFTTFASHAGPTHGLRNHGESYPVTDHQPKGAVARGQSTTYGETKLKFNQHIAAYLPRDVRSYQPVAYRCNDQGQRAESDVSGGCLDYVSASTHTKWRVRFVQPAGAGERIYQVNEHEALILHAQFDANDVSKVIYASAGASRYAAVNGSGETQVAKENNAPTQAQPQQQAKANCGDLSFLQRVACEAANKAELAKANEVLGKAIGVGVRALGK